MDPATDAQESMKPFAVYQHILRERLQFFLDPLHPLLRSDVARALREPGKLFDLTQTDEYAPVPAGSWSLLTLFIALHIAPDIDLVHASNVAIAVECLICALDLLDDVEDEDQTSIMKELGHARVLNASTTLLMLAQRMILSLAQHPFPAPRILHLLETMQESLLVATTGQQRDLLVEHRAVEHMTADECIEIAAQKAGALMSLACHMGAICAGADDESCNHYVLMGQLLGIAQQLDNDCHDLYYLLQDEAVAQSMDKDISTISKHSKTDLIRSKKTLPIILAAESQRASHAEHAPVENGPSNRKVLQEGILAGWGIALLYRERARDQLNTIEARQPVSHALRLLLGFA